MSLLEKLPILQELRGPCRSWSKVGTVMETPAPPHPHTHTEREREIIFHDPKVFLQTRLLLTSDHNTPKHAK